MNFLQPTSGNAHIMGYVRQRKKNSAKLKEDVGYLAGDVALYPKATGRELLNYLAQLQKKQDVPYRKLLERRFLVIHRQD